MEALTVSAVVSFLREVLEANEFFSDLWVVGEVSSFSRSQMGHRYFSLRDQGGVLKSVLFRDSMAGLKLQDGDRVLAHGRLTVYPQRGDLQFICDFVRPEGVGIMAAKYEELRERLEREGLFAPERKRPLPRFPLRVGVVTSPAGAALQDIRNVLERRWPLATVFLATARVQGAEAPAEVAAALRALAREPGIEVIILARGGGAAEDLSAFNTEAVARAIFGSPAPVVSGVGHETDLTIADMVADLRAPTPSAAAERATPDQRDVLRSLTGIDRAMASGTGHRLAAEAGRVDRAAARMQHAAPRPAEQRQTLLQLATLMAAGLQREHTARASSLETVEARLSTLDPRATLARGFAIVQQAKSRKVVSSVRKVRPGDRLAVSVADGAFWGEVS